MFSKSDNAWLLKRKLLRNGYECKDNKFPELEKSNKPLKENVKEKWPQLRKSINTNEIDNREGALDLEGDESRKSKADEDSTTWSSHEEENKASSKSDELSTSRKEEKKKAYKMYIKTKKEALRQEKQREKEENVLRKLVGPKGLSVSLIDAATFSKFTSAEVNHTSSVHSHEQEYSPVKEMSIDSSAFPELSQGLKKTHTKSYRNYRKSNYLNAIPGAIGGDVIPQCQSSSNFISKSAVVSSTPVSKKSRKKKDPVVVDILEAIEICKVDKKPNRLSGTGENSNVKKNDKSPPRMTGNLLDSSNPLRHRGKKREVPRKHCMTRLKKSIMAERERRRVQREMKLSDSKVNVCAYAKQPEEKSETFTTNGEFAIPHDPAVKEDVGSDDVKKIKVEPLDSNVCGKFSDSFQKLAEPVTEVTDINSMVKDTMHSKKFREYCNHSKSKELSETITLMIQDIVRFQDRLHVNQPIKAESHRRYVLGLRQTKNLLSVQKLKVIVMASDIEKVQSPGGLDDLVTSIIDDAKIQNIPVIFPFQRRQLGKLTYRKVGVSCIGILNYQGTEINFQRLVVSLDDAKRDYQDKFEKEKSKIMNELGLLNIKKEEVEPDVQPLKMEPAVTLTLLQKLTEAISEISLQSSSQIDPSGDE